MCLQCTSNTEWVALSQAPYRLRLEGCTLLFVVARCSRVVAMCACCRVMQLETELKLTVGVAQKAELAHQQEVSEGMGLAGAIA